MAMMTFRFGQTSPEQEAGGRGGGKEHQQEGIKEEKKGMGRGKWRRSKEKQGG